MGTTAGIEYPAGNRRALTLPAAVPARDLCMCVLFARTASGPNPALAENLIRAAHAACWYYEALHRAGRVVVN
jgi:hypothetical protein